MEITRKNHYVPQWHQKRFLLPRRDKLWYLDLKPEHKSTPGGAVLPHQNPTERSPKECFQEIDLYTTFPYGKPNDEIEKFLFGQIDNVGAVAARAIVENDWKKMHKTFEAFFEYLDAQKIRTPKGLDWIKSKYPRLTKLDLLCEMQGIRTMHCTMWEESVIEILSAKDSSVKFIITDHPVTIYNHACPPDGSHSRYPEDPAIALKGSQTLFPLDLEHCLVLTNLEYANNPKGVNPLEPRTNPRNFGQTILRFDTIIRSRSLNIKDVLAINYILKARATKYLAAVNEEWLYPERHISEPWNTVGDILLPPKESLWNFGGEMYVGYDNGAVHYQDAFGRTSKTHEYLKKETPKEELKPNDECLCGSGRKYRRCCLRHDLASRPLSTELSVRERNLMFSQALIGILGLDKGKSWDDVRRDLSDKQVKDLHEALACLWPRDTNILGLLPRPNPKVLRAIYVGTFELDAILKNVVAFAPHFDEIVVINPFINPDCVKPEYSPAHHPGLFKQETIKNVRLFLEMLPFVEAGVINLVPDPCMFHTALRNQIFGSAKARLQNKPLDSKALNDFQEASLKQYMRGLWRMPDNLLRKHIKTISPSISSEDVEIVLKDMRQKQLDDPTALLQPFSPTEEKGSYNISHLSPNLEMALFLAQFTGAIIYTDSSQRWGELCQLSPTTSWSTLCKTIKDLELILIGEAQFNINAINKSEYARFRTILKRIISVIQKQKGQGQKQLPSEEKLSQRLKTTGEHLNLKCEEYVKEQERQGHARGKYSCKRTAIAHIPNDGICMNPVQRMLVSHGCTNYAPSVPMAIFLNPIEINPPKP